VSGEEQGNDVVRELATLFEGDQKAESVPAMESTFGHEIDSFAVLLRDDRHRIVSKLVNPAAARVAASQREAYDQHAPLVRSLRQLGISVPSPFKALVDLVVNAELAEVLGSLDTDLPQVQGRVELAAKMGARLDVDSLRSTLRRMLEEVAEDFATRPAADDALLRLEQVVALIRAMPFTVGLRDAQTALYQGVHASGTNMRASARGGDVSAESWLRRTSELGDSLNVSVEAALSDLR
jgi:hypothetical protein